MGSPVLARASGNLLAQDGERHQRIRRLAQPAFTPTADRGTQKLQEMPRYLPGELVGMRIDGTDERGVEWTSSFGLRGPRRLPLAWAVVVVEEEEEEEEDEP